MHHSDLTPEQQTEAERLYQTLRAATDADLRAVAAFLATKDDRHLFGATEFELRDRVHQIGAKALEIAAAAQKKTAMTAPVAPAPTAAKRRNSSAGRPAPS